MFHPSISFAIGIIVLVAVMWRGRLPLPIGLVIFSILVALLSGFGIPFRHLVEGSFGYLNLILALFAGAFFGQSMRISGAADAFGNFIVKLLGSRRLLVILTGGALLYLSGALVGIAGVAVLATGVFVAPMLRRIGMPVDQIAAFIAILATCGMIAPPVNVPAMSIADGVNMPYAGFGLSLFILSIIPAIFTILFFAARKSTVSVPDTRNTPHQPRKASTVAFAALLITLGFWVLLRLFPTVIADPAVPLVLVIGGLIALPLLGRRGAAQTMSASFGGTPLVLAGVLAAVGIAVQIMTLTGVRGWLVISAMSFPTALTYVELLMLPLFGSVLTSMGTANVLGVPMAFAFIHQDMVINVAALSAISAISEFMPPTAIATALSVYVVGDTGLFRVLRQSVLPIIVIAIVAIAMLMFADQLSSLIASGSAPTSH